MDDGILTEVLGRLEDVRAYHGYWMARCPAHDDTTPSLDIKLGTDQPVVLICRAGCDTADVLAKIGLSMRDISSQDGPDPLDRDLWTPHGQATDVYQYTDEDGVLLYQVLRVPAAPGGKRQFPVRVPTATGWHWRMGTTRRVLYRLPRLRPAIEAGEYIWIAEGEKDVHSLERAGVVATCNPGGTGGGWRPEYSEVLRDAIVIIIADADKPGRAHAHKIERALQGIAAAVEIREAAEGKDVSDHLAAGLSLKDLNVTSDGDTDAEPELAVDLTVFVRQPDPPEQWVVPKLIERGDRIIWTGTPGLGKTMVTRQIAVAVAAGIHPFRLHKIPAKKVLFLDCENRVRRSRRKFRELVALCEVMRFPLQPGMFRIVHRPAGIDVTRSEDADFVLERVTAYKPDLLVIGPLYKLHAIDANEETSARAITHVLDLALGISDSALLVEAHAPHGEVLRPAGSGLFMRWPDFGYGMRKLDPQKKRRVSIEAWRGPRDDYEWPQELIWGTPGRDFPWVEPTAETRTLHQPKPRMQGNPGIDLQAGDDD
jgi:5S rRNA maturation endonuclease (ribonuclease M5)